MNALISFRIDRIGVTTRTLKPSVKLGSAVVVDAYGH
jgi:hypothetical protein